MLVDYTRIADPQWVPSAAAPLFVNTEKNSVFLKGVILHNSSGTTRNVKIYLVPGEDDLPGVPTVLNQIFEIDLTAKQTYTFDLQYPLVLRDIGDTFQAVCSAAESVAITLLGVSASRPEEVIIVPASFIEFEAMPQVVSGSPIVRPPVVEFASLAPLPADQWTPPTFHADVTTQHVYSNGNRTVTVSSTTQNTSTAGARRSNGKWYCEFIATAGSSNHMIGLLNGNSSTYPGNVSPSIGRDAGTGNYSLGVTGAAFNAASSLAVAVGQRFGIAFDMTERKAWIHKEGIWISGDPATNTTPWASWTQAGLLWRPGVRPYNTGNAVTIPMEWLHAPSGFTPQEDD